MDVCRKEYTTPYLIASCATTSGIRLFRFGLFRVGGWVGGWVCVGVGGFVWVWVGLCGCGCGCFVFKK